LESSFIKIHKATINFGINSPKANIK
jgi:hypothetical protein